MRSVAQRIITNDDGSQRYGPIFFIALVALAAIVVVGRLSGR